MDGMFLLLVDAHSKWGEMIDMAKSITAMSTVAALRHHYFAVGLPEQVVSDNSPQFTCEEFTKFLQANEVRHS